MPQELLASKTVIKEEAPSLRSISARPTAVLGLVGVTEKGPFGKTFCSTFDDYKKFFGNDVAAGDTCAAARGYFGEGGSQLYVSRVVHLTDVTDPTSKTSASAILSLTTASAAPSAGFVLGSVLGPYACVPGDTLVCKVDGGGAVTTTIAATQAARESAAGPFNIPNNTTLLVAVDGGAAQTVVFPSSAFVSNIAATVAEVAAVLNAGLVGAHAILTSGNTKVSIVSDRFGTGSSVNVSGGTANAGILAYTTGLISGTGNVSNVLAVTAGEIATAGQSATAGSTWSVVGGFVKIATNTIGAGGSIQVTGASTLSAKLGLDAAVHAGSAGAPVTTLVASGKYDGTYANALSVKVLAASSGDPTRFNLQIIKAGVIIERFANLSMNPLDARYAPSAINGNDGSTYIALADSLVAGAPLPAIATFGPMTGGNDGLAALADTDFLGGSGANGKTALRALDQVPDLTLLAIPGKATPAIHNGMIAYCEVQRAGAVFAVLDPPALSLAADIVTYVQTTAAIGELTEFAAMYWPRVKVVNPNTAVYGVTADGNVVVPPSGHIAGVMARNDVAREGGVYDPPAGIDKGKFFTVLGFETNECLDEEKRDLVYPKRINPLTTGPGLPRYIDGSRTLKGDGNFPYVGERRGVIFIERSLKQGLQFARHKNNDETLRAQAKRTVDAFLETQMKAGAFRSTNPATAFFSDFGDGLNTGAVVFANKLVGRVGLATQKPIDWVILNFSQDTRAFDTAAAGLGDTHARRQRCAPFVFQGLQVPRRDRRRRLRTLPEVLEARGGDRHHRAVRGRRRHVRQVPRAREVHRRHARARRDRRRGPLQLDPHRRRRREKRRAR